MNTKLRKILDERRSGLSVAVVGAPGTGKSSFLGAIGEVFSKDEVLLLCPKPREINSWRYDEYGFSEKAEVFHDPKWKPALSMFEASAFNALERRVLDLYDDEQHRVIILDPYTDVVKLASHDLLKVDKAGTPRESSDSRGYYGALKHRLGNFTNDLVNLTSPSLRVPKLVLVAVHAQPAKEDEKAGGVGVSFEGDVMPMIDGGHRHDFAGEFDVVCYSRIKHSMKLEGGKQVKSVNYVVQIGADAKRHAKVAIAPRLTETEVENSVTKLLELALG